MMKWKEMETILSGRDTVMRLRTAKAKGELPDEVVKLFDVPERRDFHPEGNSGEHTLLTINEVENESPMIKYAMLVHDLGKVVTYAEQQAKDPAGDKSQMTKHFGHDEKGIALVKKVSSELGAPQEYAEFAEIVCKMHMKMHMVGNMKDAKLFEFNQEIPDKYFEPFMKCCLADTLGRGVPEAEKAKIREDFASREKKLTDVRSFMKQNPNDDRNTFANNYAKYKKGLVNS